MSANTETTGADRTKCKAWCGRTDQRPANGNWDGGPFQSDFRYWDTADGEVPSELAGKPMWCSSDCRDARLPPIAAPAAHVERRKGQRWVVKRDDQPAYETTLDARDCDGWFTVSSRGGGWIHDDCWDLPAYTMTLLADAPPEPAKCEPWCGNDLPPEGRPGWGFLLDDDADIAERFKLGRAGFVKRDLAIGWCTDECRESYISKTGFREMKSPPAQEAPKAAPVCENPHGDNGSDIDTVVVDGRVHRWCVPCWSAYVVWTAEQTGRSYAGPERLPRPQLAADRVEDCLGDVR